MKHLFKLATLTKFGISLLLFAASVASAAIVTGSTGSHDPSRMINCAGTYYIYSTGGGMMHSTDRINWSSGTSPFSSFSGSRPPKMKAFIPSDQGIWAPDVIFYNNQYYLYYAIASSDGATCAVGLITSPTLDPGAGNYHWTDAGVVVSSPANVSSTGVIDPCPFVDASNNLWLSYGSNYTQPASNEAIYVSRLDNTTGLLISTNNNFYPIEPGHIEGSYVYYHNGYYYAFWNSGGCCNGSSSTYTIHMARSSAVTGPYADKSGNTNSSTTFLASTVTMNSVDGPEHGPGQIGILSEGGIDHCTYHYYPNSGGSVIGEETLIWGADGWPSCGADLAPGTYKVSSVNSGLTMGVYQAGTTNGVALDQETYTGSSYQQWAVAYTTNGSAADGYYSLTSVGSGLVADLAQSNTNNGTLIDQWAWGNGNNQRWFIEQTSEGYYRMVSRMSQSVITVTNFSNTSGTWLDEMVWNNTVNQEWVIGTTSGTPPATPTGLTAAASTGQVALTWTTVSGATTYDVKRGTTSGGPYTTSIGNPTSASFTDTGVSNGTTYYYVVSAVNASGISAKSSQVSATPEPPAPPTPTGLAATPGNNQVALTWNTSSGATSYNVKRSTTSGSGYATIASPTTTSYTDTTAANGTTYYYVVSAVNTGGESANSSQVSATPSGGGGSGFTSPIVLVNPGFETNTSGVVFTSKVSTGFDVSGNDVAGWLNAGSTYASSGVDYAGDSGVVVHGGSVTAYCDQGDSGAYQITGYPMQAGDQLTLTWWAKSSYNNAAQSVSLLSGASPGSAFSSLTTLATSTAALNNTGNGGAYTQYTLTYTAGAADAGKYVAVSFLAPGTAGSWAMFDDFALSVTSLLPSPWASGDIGAVGVAGSASATTNGLFTVAGSGADIWGAGDQLRYVYQPASGDCSVQAEVLSVQNTQSHAKGGVMIRETLNTNSAMAMVDLTPSAGVEFVWRTNTAASAASTVVAGITAPNWVKVTRTGNSFVGYYSTNGTAWTVLGTNTITMGTGVYVGLPVCAHNNTVTCTATFTNVVAAP